MTVDPLVISAAVVAAVMVATIGMLMHMSKPEKTQAERHDAEEPTDPASM